MTVKIERDLQRSVHDNLQSHRPLTRADFNRPWHGAEAAIDPSGNLFEQQRQAYLAKHADEPQLKNTGRFKFALVTRAKRELSNGNLAEKLKSFAVQQLPRNSRTGEYDFRAYIAVNDNRVSGISAEVFEANKQDLDAAPTYLEKNRLLSNLVRARYKELELTMSQGEEVTTSTFNNGEENALLVWQRTERDIRDFRENQITLGILAEITEAVTFDGDVVQNKTVREQALSRIQQLAAGFLKPMQMRALLQAAGVVIEKKIPVMGVDCNSAPKAHTAKPLAKATNEAMHLAVAQGAEYLDVADMDQYHGSSSLVEMNDWLAADDTTAYFVRPLQTRMPQHPEQFHHDENAWTRLVDYYARSASETATKYGRYTNSNTGTLVVSAAAFRLHPYPEDTANEDYVWAQSLRKTSRLKVIILCILIYCEATADAILLTTALCSGQISLGTMLPKEHR